MPYLGKSPSAGVRQRYQYTATASQTTFSGTDTANLTLNYTDNNFVDVYQNGVLLKGGATDYTATSGTSVVLATGATADDVIEIIVYDAFSAANFYSRTDSDSRYLNVAGDTMTGSLDLNGTELVLDADADTSITADTDDQIDIKVGGSDRFKFDNSGHVSLLTDGASLKFGADSEVILRHSADNGLEIDGSGINTVLSINAFHATDSTTPDLSLHKSGSSTIGTQAATADSEPLGKIRFSGVDTSGDKRNGAVILSLQDGTSSDSVPAIMDFQTNGFTRLRLDKSGRMFTGGNTAEPSNSISGIQLSNPDTLSAPKISVGSSTALRTMMEFINGNGSIGSIKTTGTTTQFNTSSDYRLKENIVTDWDATTRLKQLKPSRFNFKTNADVTLDGFLAHEVSAIAPEAVSGEKDETQDLGTIKDKDGNVVEENVLETRTKKDDGQTWTKTKTENVYQGIDQSKLVPLLTKALQESIARADALEARIKKLEDG